MFSVECSMFDVHSHVLLKMQALLQ